MDEYESTQYGLLFIYNYFIFQTIGKTIQMLIKIINKDTMYVCRKCIYMNYNIQNEIQYELLFFITQY